MGVARIVVFRVPPSRLVVELAVLGMETLLTRWPPVSDGPQPLETLVLEFPASHPYA